MSLLPLASWLSSPWRHTKTPDYAAVVDAALALDRRVSAEHHITLAYTDDASRFRDISEKEVMRAQRADMGLGDADYPQLGTHADPLCRDLTRGNFYGLIGTRPDRPMLVFTMNTAALYRPTPRAPRIAHLFLEKSLWSDHPKRDCTDLDVAVSGIDTTDAMFAPLPAIHTGTAWTTPDRRGHGIMRLVSRLHRIVARLAFGPLPQFATVVPNRDHDKLFEGREIGRVIETRPKSVIESRVLFWSPEDIAASVAGVLKGE